MSGSKSTDLALKLLYRLPRVSVNNLRPLQRNKRASQTPRGQYGGGLHGDRNYGTREGRGTLPPLGWEGGQTPYFLKHPSEMYYKNFRLRRQYPPLSMLNLQRMIDTGLLDPDQPVDLGVICNTKVYRIDPWAGHFGVNLTEEGIDRFAAKVNLEVQWASENVIAAVEKNGGTITLAYYDPVSLQALHDPGYFFTKGTPIPRRSVPPENCLEHYSNPKMRGYLANPKEVSEARLELAQKFGYTLPDITKDPLYDMLMKRKDPRQVFYGLEPGWVVNLTDKVVLKPTDELLRTYYQS
ncbi:39S ribosomal protein L15, mitochondrial-like [Paramacrobiotus metropolitanus]|uniref:39S ribosomal protein L15, mitochondrial-like n=1 Tax=Paramacrobiotus metropolitanus TaxID=2943436 RepID=UPI0024463069|nr:39S ribosomal protein L15, mitochondrial-like [Paramacrobiotus metropolitanus]